jgi:hypothetical protein
MDINGHSSTTSQPSIIFHQSAMNSYGEAFLKSMNINAPAILM